MTIFDQNKSPIPGDNVIGDILDQNMVLLPFAIDSFGRFGPILRHFLFNTAPRQHITFHPSRPNATKMYKRIMTLPCPKGVLPLADHHWIHTRTREFFGHSYSSPTPSITTLQNIGLCISKALQPMFVMPHGNSVIDPPCSSHLRTRTTYLP